MPIVVVPANVPAQQVEFPEGVERSRKGALYVRPASTLDITEGELAFIKATLPAIASQLIVVGESPSLATKLAARAATEKDPEMRRKLQEAVSASEARRAKQQSQSPPGSPSQPPSPPEQERHGLFRRKKESE